MRKSPLLQRADVLLFVTDAETERSRRAVATAFAACNSTRVVAVPNPGKQKGAMIALQAAEQRGWFDGYDWIVRVNPDVVIRSDAHLQPLFERSDVHALFVNCPAGRMRLRVQTDFVAWRPERVPRGAFAIHPGFSEAFCRAGDNRYSSPICNPERAVTRSFQSIVASGRYALLPTIPGCRVGRPWSAVVHSHAYVGHCARDLQNVSAAYLAPHVAGALAPTSAETDCYAKRYPDLHRAHCRSGRCDAIGLTKHYWMQGRREGRRWGC